MRKLRKKSYSKIYKNLTLKFSFILMICVFTITIGYSALSSTLSINGSAKFTPIGMIKVMSIERNSLVDTTEIDRGYTDDTINVLIDLNQTTSTATYDVTITNLGQIDKQLTQILEDIYTNSDTEYEINGLDINDVIEAGDSVTFTVTFKYKNGVTPQTSRLNAQLQFVFDDYVPPVTFLSVFSEPDACTFNGTNVITGNNCDYAGQHYIDTGVLLYDNDNWQKDYEIGFTIESYVPADQVNQAVFVNSKYEKESLKWPGIVFRREDATNKLQVTQSINNGSKVTKSISNYTLPLDVKILRINGVVSYSLNGAPLITVQDMSNFNQQFNVTTWFGAAPDENGTMMRNLKGTLSNMYVKVGTYEPDEYTVTFNANGGSVSAQPITVTQFTQVGALPTPTYNANYVFAGWYTDTTYQTRITSSSYISKDIELVAKWVLTKSVEMNGDYYDTIAEALTASGSGLTTIKLLDDVDEIVTIPSGKNIILDLQNHNMTNPTSNAIITNEGQLKVINGTLTNSSTFAVIDNSSTGTLEIQDATLVGTNTKQAVYNNGGTLTISGNSTLSATSSIRATVHNLNNGTTIIKGGTILATNYSAIKNDGGTLIIGDDDGSVDTTTPLIQGKPYGVTSAVNYSMYDGIIKGTTKAVNDDTKITTIDSNSQKTTGTESINGTTYKTLYLTQTVNNNNNNSNGLMASPRRRVAETLNTVFEINGTCNFDGLGGNITGEGCEAYSDKGYIDTGISLFSNENWEKDFEIYFELSNYNPDQPDTSTIQNTIMNSLTESLADNNPGMVFRKNGNNLTLKVNGTSQSVVSINTAYTDVNKVKIVRKNKKIYYSVNDDELTEVYDFTDFNKQFDLPVWFGASANLSGNPYRYTKCTLSNIYIKLGN